ncbi:putative C6 transcription factor [Talaromyces proteolyticus]|uniref:C6 transcription factor n=1 Tax=Talaromyces proteolyticus TaxID=1131652 RepID=A0AAD4PUX8_9EURO|nr:putative C6 transcription factor [Talaromyces proteolyticus]KAH8692744.1 putative C6 transcription factor [Talaromyces proteolyticus]
MASQSSPLNSPGTENNDDDLSAVPDPAHGDEGADIHDEMLDDHAASQLPHSKQAIPMQKRRRVTRACDECRRKKIKCDGKQPCTHCTVYSYDCTYDQPSNRRRNPTPQHIEALESRLHRAEALLRILAPDLNINDPSLDTASSQEIAAIYRQQSQLGISPPKPTSTNAPSQEPSSSECADESLLQTMMENSGSLDLDDQGHWDYHGHSSGVIFMQRLRKQLGNFVTPPRALSKPRSISQILETPKSQSESPQDSSHNSNLPPTHDLPPRSVADKLCRNSFDHACVLMRCLHEPSFSAMVDRIYASSWDQFTNEEHTFLPLLYVVMAVGCLFSDDVESTLDVAGYEGAIGQGFQYFRACRQLLDITDCRDLTTLQAICFMILFLQSSAKLSTCYSYVGIALRASLRLGLHRTVAANFNPVERELRKRIFWVVRKMDVYVSTLLGLPQMVSIEDIDQEYPLEIDDEYISAAGIIPMPSDTTSLMAGANAHTRLVDIIVKVVKYIYPVKPAKYRTKSDHTYMVSHSKIREIERDLQAWMEALPSALRPGDEVSTELERMRQLLRISYAYVQMIMYRPFLHYVSNGFQSQGIDKRSYACAAACVSVSRNVVHITAGMYKRGLLNGSYWFTMYTTYFAILSLVFFVLENPDLPTAKDSVLKDALEGKNTLAGLAKKSMAADRCAQSLNSLFKQLPEKLKTRQSSTANPVNLKRPTPSSIASTPRTQGKRPSSMHLPLGAPQRSNSFPLQLNAGQSKTPPESNSSPSSVDDNRLFDRSQTWHTNGTPLKVETFASPSPVLPNNPTPTLSSHSQSHSRQPSLQSQGLDSSQNLPDLMPIMFPSNDPFAYPTQPLSTLEDRHFKDELSSASYLRDPVLQNSSALSSNNAFSNVTSGFDGYPGIYGLPAAASARLPSTLPSQFQHLGLQSQVQSPSPHSSTPEKIQSPDLVSLPHQFMWQGFGFPNQSAAPNTTQQPMSGSQDVQTDAAVGNEFTCMGMGLDMDVNLDDVFGNMGTNMVSNQAMNDDWSQWMNSGS